MASVEARRADTPDPYLRPHSAFEVWCDPAVDDVECGNDYVTYRTLADGTLALVMLGVAGRGKAWRLPAYFLATNLIGLLTIHCPLERAAALADRDSRLEFGARKLEPVSVFAAVADPFHTKLHYVAAGFDRAVLKSAGGRGTPLPMTAPAFGSGHARGYGARALRFLADEEIVLGGESPAVRVRFSG